MHTCVETHKPTMHDGAFYYHRPQPTLNPWCGREIQPETPANENRRIHFKTEPECTDSHSPPPSPPGQGHSYLPLVGEWLG